MNQPERTIVSDSGRYQARIERRSGDGFLVTVYRLTEEWMQDGTRAGEYWQRVSRGITIADTIERAEALAAEEVRVAEATGM